MDTAPIVLVVDDEPEITSFTLDVLTEAGCCAIPAKDGNEALQILKEFRVDVLLTDMCMPRPDCWDLLEAAGRTPVPTPAIVMTGCLTDVLHEEATRRGATAVLQKPFSRPDLLAAVTGAARRRDLTVAAGI